MKLKRTSLFICLIIVVTACNNSQFGIAHQALEKTYPFTAFGRTIYSESLLRTATQLVNLDSTNQLSQGIRYVLQYEIDTASRRYVEGTDSIVLHALKQAGMETFFEMESNGIKAGLYIDSKDQIITDAVFIKQDSSNFQLYELVGELPLGVILTSGIENRDALFDLINFDLFANGSADTTNQ